MKIQPRIKPTVEMIKDFPTVVLTRVERKKHFKLYLSTPAGEKILVVSMSTSDPQRAALNNRALVRRWATSLR